MLKRFGWDLHARAQKKKNVTSKSNNPIYSTLLIAVSILLILNIVHGKHSLHFVKWLIEMWRISKFCLSVQESDLYYDFCPVSRCALFIKIEHPKWSKGSDFLTFAIFLALSCRAVIGFVMELFIQLKEQGKLNDGEIKVCLQLTWSKSIKTHLGRCVNGQSCFILRTTDPVCPEGWKLPFFPLTENIYLYFLWKSWYVV